MIKENITDINYFKKMYTIDIFNEDLSLTNMREIESKSDLNFIDESDILITNHYNKLNFNPQKINIEYFNYIDNFILIVDFFNLGGGTTFFINSIVSKYKTHKTLLIARSYSNKIVFTINDEYEIDKYFDNLSANLFLQEKKNNIEKILVNHTLGHNILFLNELFKLEKEVSIITHDYYLIDDVPGQLIHNIKKVYTNENKININKFNTIITQNKKNLSILHNHINKKDTLIIITELPDYKESLDLIKTSNEQIVLGLFGAITDIKGLYILKDIINYYKLNKNVKIIVFGICHIPNFNDHYVYHNIKELNDLLIKFKPNILMELSICPETYSYTLSLKMLTKLPIIYFKKTGNFVVENRLSTYDKAYPFETLEEFDKLINLHKQDYLYTIKPVIYFNHYWDEYFINLKTDKTTNIILNNKAILFNYYLNFGIQENIYKCFKIQEKKNIVFITSKIYVSNQKFSYTKNRSIYSKLERLNQTLETIKSVKKHIPNYFIILIDNSNFMTDEIRLIESSVDLFLNPTKDNNLNYYTNECIYKAYGELNQTKILINCLSYLINNSFINCNNLFKLSGRYLLNDTFNYNDYDNNYNNFKLNKQIINNKYYYTCLYKISFNNLQNYYNVINILVDETSKTSKYNNFDYEVFLPSKLKNIYLLENLGMTQNISVWNDKSNI